MLTIKSLQSKIKALNVDQVINEAFDSTTDDLADINRERMNDGVRSNGVVMPHYSYVSQKVYGYPDTPIKLKATGSFQAEIFAKRDGSIIHQDSKDGKSKMLQARYGPEIFGTGGEYKKEYQKGHLRPALMTGIRSKLGLKKAK